MPAQQQALQQLNLITFPCDAGESVDDCGGGYSESIAEMCDELQNGSLPLLIVTPNGRDESGANRDCFLLNPSLISPLQQNMFRFLGEMFVSCWFCFVFVFALVAVQGLVEECEVCGVSQHVERAALSSLEMMDYQMLKQ